MKSDQEIVAIRRNLVAGVKSPHVSPGARDLAKALIELLDKVSTSRDLTVLRRGR